MSVHRQGMDHQRHPTRTEEHHPFKQPRAYQDASYGLSAKRPRMSRHVHGWAAVETTCACMLRGCDQ